MIRNESEYQEAIKRLQQEEQRFTLYRDKLKEMRMTVGEMERAMEPLQAFHAQLQQEVACYERLRRGDMAELARFTGLESIGPLLVALRIFQGLSQRDLAERLGVHESQVSRDERNDYFGVTVERLKKIVQALGARLKVEVQVDQPAQVLPFTPEKPAGKARRRMKAAK